MQLVAECLIVIRLKACQYYIKNESKYLCAYDHLSTSWTRCEPGGQMAKLWTLEEVIEVIKVMAKSAPLYPSYTIELAME